MTKQILLLLAAAVAVPSSAMADQCAWVSYDQAYAAQQHVLNNRTYVEYCKPCEDEKATAPKVAKTAEIKHRKRDFYQLEIDGKPVDLAYTYLKQTAAQARGWFFENLAGRARCPVRGVPSLIKLGKDNTVLLPGE